MESLGRIKIILLCKKHLTFFQRLKKLGFDRISHHRVRHNNEYFLKFDTMIQFIFRWY